MAKRIRYYYDEESCTFQKEQISARAIFKTVLSYVSISGLLAILGLTVYFTLYDDPKHLMLKNQNAALVQKIQALEGQFAMLEEQVDALHETDNNFYRSIMEADPIEDGLWNGGIGGAVAKDDDMPEVLRDAENRLERLKAKAQNQDQSYNQLFKLLKENEDELRHMPSIKPVPGAVISGFGMRTHPIHKIRKMHTGLDMQASVGTPVYAAGDGTVTLAGMSRGGYGIQVEMDHGGYGYQTKYAHLSKVNVKRGQKVKRGEIIGWTGNTGLSKGPHLHYEIIKNNKKIDPIDYFYGDISPEDYVEMREAAKVENESMD